MIDELLFESQYWPWVVERREKGRWVGGLWVLRCESNFFSSFLVMHSNAVISSDLPEYSALFYLKQRHSIHSINVITNANNKTSTMVLKTTILVMGHFFHEWLDQYSKTIWLFINTELKIVCCYCWSLVLRIIRQTGTYCKSQFDKIAIYRVLTVGDCRPWQVTLYFPSF